MKLRKTGFEFSQSFVIRLAGIHKDCSCSPERGWGPPLESEVVSAFHKNLMSFPINFGVAKIFWGGTLASCVCFYNANLMENV